MNVLNAKHQTALLRIAFLLLLSSPASSQTLTVKDARYKLVTAFQKLSNAKDNIFAIALARRNGDTENYYLLLENHLADFSQELIDTTDLVDLQVKGYLVKNRGSSSWMEQQFFIFPLIDRNVSSNSKGIVVAFKISSTDAHDIRNQNVGNFILHGVDTTGKYRMESRSDILINGDASKFFAINATKITATKGSFDNLARYKSKPIVLYSLFYKDFQSVEKILGQPVDSLSRGQELAYQFQTADGRYDIVFRNNRSNSITLIPRARIKYVGKLFFFDKFPFEVTGCACGEFSQKETSSSSDKNKRGDGVIFTARDKSSHRIMFHFDGVKYLEKVTVEESL
jgi:hypothetical protein